MNKKENARTVEITELEAKCVADMATAFFEMTKFQAANMSEQQAIAVCNHAQLIDSFLDKVKQAFKHNKPVRKAKIYSVDGTRL